MKHFPPPTPPAFPTGDPQLVSDVCLEFWRWHFAGQYGAALVVSNVQVPNDEVVFAAAVFAADTLIAELLKDTDS